MASGKNDTVKAPIRASHPFEMLRIWTTSFFDTLLGRTGWKLVAAIAGSFFTLLGLYTGIYSIITTKYAIRANQAALERTMFTTMVTSGEPAEFIAAMKSFGPVQTFSVPEEPPFWIPWRWFKQEKTPNLDPLYLWAFYTLPVLCKSSDPESARCWDQEDPSVSETSWRIDLREANLSQALLSETKLYKAHLAKAKLLKAYLDKADLTGADFSRATLTEANLYKAILREATLRTANLEKAYLVDAHLEKADLSWANLDKADLENTHLQEATLTGATLNEANLRLAELMQANLSKATLHAADLHRTYLTKATLSSANLHGADLNGADLTEANLTAANLSETDLSGASLYRAILQNAILRESILDGAHLGEADLSGADLRGANLVGVKALTQEQLKKACVNAKTKLPANLNPPPPCAEKP